MTIVIHEASQVDARQDSCDTEGARVPTQAHRQHRCRSRIAKHRRAGDRARRASDWPRRIAHQTAGGRRSARSRRRVAIYRRQPTLLQTIRNLPMNIATTIQAAEELKPDLLTEQIVSKLGNPETNSDFDFHGTVNDVLKDVGMSTADSGGKLTFYGRDPIIP